MAEPVEVADESAVNEDGYGQEDLTESGHEIYSEDHFIEEDSYQVSEAVQYNLHATGESQFAPKHVIQAVNTSHGTGTVISQSYLTKQSQKPNSSILGGLHELAEDLEAVEALGKLKMQIDLK